MVNKEVLVLVEIWKFVPGTSIAMLDVRFVPLAVKKFVPTPGLPEIAVSPPRSGVDTVSDVSGGPSASTVPLN